MAIDINSFVAASAANGTQGLLSGTLLGIPAWQVAGMSIGFIITAILLLIFLKRIIENIILGLVAWAIVAFVFHVELPLIPTFIATILFGLGGIGAMLLAKLLGF
ncbi:MAG: hypothetical protein WC602_05345 [archaeon]